MNKNETNRPSLVDLRNQKINQIIDGLRNGTIRMPNVQTRGLSEKQATEIEKLAISTEKLKNTGVRVSNQQYPFGFT